MMTSNAQDSINLGLLRWRCRRGLLENDLLLERFFVQHGNNLSPTQMQALLDLMALGDNELLDLLMARKEPDGELDVPEIHAILKLIRPSRN